MNIRRCFKMMVTNPNSIDGLTIRAELLEEKAYKVKTDKEAEKLLLYAEVLRRLSEKGMSPLDNKIWIKNNLRTFENEWGV